MTGQTDDPFTPLSSDNEEQTQSVGDPPKLPDSFFQVANEANAKSKTPYSALSMSAPGSAKSPAEADPEPQSRNDSSVNDPAVAPQPSKQKTSGQTMEKIHLPGSASQQNATPQQLGCCPFLHYIHQKPSWWRRHPFLTLICLACLALFIYSASHWFVTYGPLSGPQIGLVDITGSITHSEKTIEWIDSLALDQNVRGVLVRVDSAGGAVVPAQELYMAIKRLAAVKPVVVSIGGMGTSGAYYASIAATEIFANPASLVGGVGVISMHSNFENLYKMIGYSQTTLTTGALKNAGADDRPMTEEETLYLQNLLHDIQDQFITDIATHRQLSPETIALINDGRALIGRQAVPHKLVDALGDMNTAARRLRELCNIQPTQNVRYIQTDIDDETTSLFEELMGIVQKVQINAATLQTPPQAVY